MFIERAEKNKPVRFDYVKPGTVVEFNGSLLLKIQDDGDTNAVGLEDGGLWQLEGCDMVLTPNAKLIVN